jgi:hypothetical protein
MDDESSCAFTTDILIDGTAVTLVLCLITESIFIYVLIC